MVNRNKPQIGQTHPSISIRSTGDILKEIADVKELAEKDITKFCRDKAVELLYGYQVSGERIVRVDTLETLEVLKFLNNIEGGKHART